MKIGIKESSIVQPSQNTPKHQLWASNLDLVMIRVHMPVVFYYKPNGSGSSSFFKAQDIKEALSKALVSFYPVAGRLEYDDNGRIEIHCNAQGVLFVEAETDSAIDDLKDLHLPWSLNSSCQKSTTLVAYLLIHSLSHRCGEVALGVGLHHTIADAASVLHFLKTWAAISRGVSTSIKPLHDRTLLQAHNPLATAFHHIEYDPSPSMNTTTNTNSNLLPNPSVAIFKITLEQLNTLISIAKTDEQTTKYSTYEILTAHIWRCTCKARGLTNDQVTKLYMPVDGRSRLNPPLPPGYFGNAVFFATSIALSGDLQSEPLINTVGRIHKAMKQMDDDHYLRSAIDYIQLQPNLSSIVRGARTYKSPNLNINKWSQFPVKDIDFGWGQPMFMGLARVLLEGVVLILPTTTNEGSISLAICLEAHQMQLFKRFLYDFQGWSQRSGLIGAKL